MDLSGALKSKERKTMREKRGRGRRSVRGRERTIKVCLRLNRQVCQHAKGQTDLSCDLLRPAGVRWRRSRMASGGGIEESERGHRGRNTELRRSISDMNLSLRRRQGNHVGKDPRGSGNRPNNNNGGVQDRKNIVSMINPQPGQVKQKKDDVV